MLRLHLSDTLSALPSAYATGEDEEAVILPSIDAVREAVWIDLAFPGEDERKLVEQATGLELPTRADMTEIEASSRVYREGEARIMNVLLVVGADSNTPAAEPVSLILNHRQLITIRYCDPHAFRSMDSACARTPPGPDAQIILLKLLDFIVDRTADILEKVGGEIDSLSALIFGRSQPASRRLSTNDLQLILQRVGNTQHMLNKAHESLITLSRAMNFMASGGEDADAGDRGLQKPERHAHELLKTLARDIGSLSENCSYLTNNVAFLLDAALGRISIEQNAIVKIFSIAAVIFLPPTLVASIYGMNFKHMPELDQVAGYPAALLAMLVSAILPYFYFRRKGWL